MTGQTFEEQYPNGLICCKCETQIFSQRELRTIPFEGSGVEPPIGFVAEAMAQGAHAGNTTVVVCVPCAEKNACDACGGSGCYTCDGTGEQ